MPPISKLLLISTELLIFIFSVMDGSEKQVICRWLGQMPPRGEDSKKCCHMTVEKKVLWLPQGTHVTILGDTG